jgi:hypothetical protein
MLTGPEQLEWRDALFATFSEQDFKDLLFYRLNDPIANYASDKTALRTAIGAVITSYSQRDIEGNLIVAAVEARPRNSVLLQIARHKSAVTVPVKQEVERLIVDTNALIDIREWVEKLGRIQACVCRIEITAQSPQGPGKIYGTGFLIDEDVVLTNYHVMECVIAAEDKDTTYTGPTARASQVKCRFDYHDLKNGGTSPGNVYGLSTKWRVTVSPNSPDGQMPKANELDFAAIQLERPVGSLTVGEKAFGEARGYLKLSDVPTGFGFEAKSPMFIVQHPEGRPIRLALDTNAVKDVNANRTRVTYTTNTEKGSSGSPCFDQNWNLIALHHSGDPNFEPDHRPEFNEGIPIDSIVKALQKAGVPIR